MFLLLILDYKSILKLYKFLLNIYLMIDIKTLCEVGDLAKEIKKEISTMIKVSNSSKNIIDFVEKKIFSNNYSMPFPCMVVVNNKTAHHTIYEENENIIFKKGDVVNVDFGICKDGWICDTALTIEIETKVYSKLLKTNREILDEVLDKVEIGMNVCEIGKIVHSRATQNGFDSIHNLSGHQIKQNLLHSNISIPNYDNKDTTKIEDNSIFAIEPFLTMGEPKVVRGGNSNILHLKNYRQTRNVIAMKVLKHIKENYPFLPFSKRWLINDVIKNLNPKILGFDKRQVDYAVSILKKENILIEYELLESIDGKITSQFEETIVFFEGKKYITTKTY